MDNKKTLNENYICPLCQEIFTFPYKMIDCEHAYCKKCVETVQKYAILKPNFVSYNSSNKIINISSCIITKESDIHLSVMIFI